MERDRGLNKIDESLVVHVSTFPPGAQRWLRTVLQAISSTETAGPEEEEGEAQAVAPAFETEVAIQAEQAIEAEPATLEEVITGQANLRDHLAAYPELAEELEGLADIIDMLRDAGEARRRRGEQILREEILGETDEPAPEGEEEAESQEGDSAPG
jgi:hypothetical protein